MMKVAMEHGDDFHDFYDYYYNEFGIVEEEDEENTKVQKLSICSTMGDVVFRMHICIIKLYQQKTKRVNLNGVA